ncbi:MAG: sugar phosphate isomerase/epimerase [Ruthenibacterium sp.]
MRLSLSNIGFAKEDSLAVYALLQKYGYAGLEIAPGIFAGDAPYDHTAAAAEKAGELARNYGLAIASMQSIWYGCTGNLFLPQEAEALAATTEKAVRFAQALSCGNLVFGCPKNRRIPQGGSAEDAVPFFARIAQYAAINGTCIALEANPPVYGTNFCNTSGEAFCFARRVPQLKVNYDLGTLLTNGEDLQSLADNLALVNHIHLSEPQLAPIEQNAERRALHKALAELLREQGYAGYVSIEMKAQPLAQLERILAGAAEVFAW